MGFIRKSLSVATLGTAVNYRSKNERKVKVLESDSKAQQAAEKQRLEIESRRAEAEMLAARALAAQGPRPIEVRLRKLDELYFQGVVTAEDYSLRKGQILNEI